MTLLSSKEACVYQIWELYEYCKMKEKNNNHGLAGIIGRKGGGGDSGSDIAIFLGGFFFVSFLHRQLYTPFSSSPTHPPTIACSISGKLTLIDSSLFFYIWEGRGMGCINWDLGNGVEDEQKRGRRKSQHWHYNVGFGINPERSEIDVRVEEKKRLVHYCVEINKYKEGIDHAHSFISLVL